MVAAELMGVLGRRREGVPDDRPTAPLAGRSIAALDPTHDGLAVAVLADHHRAAVMMAIASVAVTVVVPAPVAVMAVAVDPDIDLGQLH